MQYYLAFPYFHAARSLASVAAPPASIFTDLFRLLNRCDVTITFIVLL